MDNVLGYHPRQSFFTKDEIARIGQLKDKFAGGHTAWIETEKQRMKTEQEIKDKLTYEKKIQKEYKGCTFGTDGY